MTRIEMTSYAARYLSDEDRAVILEVAPSGSSVRLGYSKNPGDWTCRIQANDRAQTMLGEAYHARNAMAAFLRAMAQMEAVA